MVFTLTELKFHQIQMLKLSIVIGFVWILKATMTGDLKFKKKILPPQKNHLSKCEKKIFKMYIFGFMKLFSYIYDYIFSVNPTSMP